MPRFRRFRRSRNARFARSLIRKARRKASRRRAKSSFTRLAIKTGIVEKSTIRALFKQPQVTTLSNNVDSGMSFWANENNLDLYARRDIFFPICNDQRITNYTQGKGLNQIANYTLPGKIPYTPVRVTFCRELSYSVIPFPVPYVKDAWPTGQAIQGDEMVLRGLRASFGLGYRDGLADPDHEDVEVNWIRVSLVRCTFQPGVRNELAVTPYGWNNATDMTKWANQIVQNLPNPMIPQNRPMWKTPYANGSAMRNAHPRPAKRVAHDSTNPAHTPVYIFDDSTSNDFPMVNPMGVHEQFRIKELKRVVMFAKKSQTENFDKIWRKWLHKIDKKVVAFNRDIAGPGAAAIDPVQSGLFHPDLKEWYALVIISNCPADVQGEAYSNVAKGFFIENPQLSVTYLP